MKQLIVTADGEKRFAALFMGCGVNPVHWWAKGSGPEMELGPCLAPLAPLKAKINVINGLFNKRANGVGIHPGQTGNILSGAALPTICMRKIPATASSGRMR